MIIVYGWFFKGESIENIFGKDYIDKLVKDI